jgi:uncharacterized membrane protein YecN with MAPEG domain
MMIVPVTAVFAAALGLLLVVLSFLVSRHRLRLKQNLGVSEDIDFQATVRAQANLVEYAPIGLIMLAIAELNGVSGTLIYWTGLGFVVGRLLHAFGMINGRGSPHMARMAGIVLTWLGIVVLALLLIWNVFQVYG